MKWGGLVSTGHPVSGIFELNSCQRGEGGHVSLPIFEKGGGGGGTGGPTCVTRSSNGLI